MRRGGLPQTEARLSANMGNVVHALEDSRARWNFAWLESLLVDVRYAQRSFRRTPIFAGTVITKPSGIALSSERDHRTRAGFEHGAVFHLQRLKVGPSPS